MKSFFVMLKRERYLPSPPDHAHVQPKRYYLFTVKYISTSPELIDGIRLII